MLVTKKEEIEKVIAEGKAIQNGQNPQVAASEAGASPSAPPGTAAAGASYPPEAPPSPPVELGLISEFLFVLPVDLCARLMENPEWGMQEPVRSQAIKAGEQIIERYFPVVGRAGPIGALLACYLVHFSAIYMQWQIVNVSLSSDKTGAERPPS